MIKEIKRKKAIYFTNKEIEYISAIIRREDDTDITHEFGEDIYRSVMRKLSRQEAGRK